MSRHRAREGAAKRRPSGKQLVRGGVGVLAVGALVASVLTFLASPDIPVIAELGKSVKGQTAAPVRVEKAGASSRTQLTPTVRLGADSWRLSLHGSQDTSVVTRTADGAIGARVRGRWTALGTTDINVAPATEPGQAARSAIRDVKVSVVSKPAAKKQGAQGIVLKLVRSDGSAKQGAVAVKVPKELLSQQFGADYAERVQWVQVEGSKQITSASATPVATATDRSNIMMTPMVSSRAVTLAATSSPVSSNGAGSFSATPLKQAGSWAVSAQTGDFSWQYPMDVPDAPAGPSPDLSLTYDSQSVDGETGSTNNQPSSVGEGWELGGGGFIERQYTSCSIDDGASGPIKTSGDLCWKTDNATISLDGHSSALVRDATSGTWKLESDDGSRVEHLVGIAAGCSPNGTYDVDCWRVTTTDGTQYYFGKNQLPGWSSGKATTNSTWTVPVFGNDPGEPCHASTFAASSCVQAWRWNLDYVVDTHNNAEAFYYAAETNHYDKTGSGATSYIRGGQLDHIDYGMTASTVYTANSATARASFGYNAYGRCSDASHANCTQQAITAAAAKPSKPTYYPDVPWDQFCTTSCTANPVPTFWTNGMLDTVTTAVKSGTTYATVDKWALSHSFPAPGDETTAALWLTQVQHTGYAGSATLSEPAVKFNGVRMQNRVWAVDGLAPLDKLRISSITSETGAVTSVNYSAQECTADQAATIEADLANNERRCFPQWWSGNVLPPQEPKLDLFHKYVVTSVIDDPKTGGGNDRPQETNYVYVGKPAWKYNTSVFTPEKRRTWSAYAGYDRVDVRNGRASEPANQKVTEYTFYRGLDGDRAGTDGGQKAVNVSGATNVKDSAWLAGRTRSEVVRNGVNGAVISTTVSTPWVSAVRADDGAHTARQVDDGSVVVTEPVSTGGNRTTTTATSYDGYGNTTQVATTSSDAGATCSTTTYAAANTSAWIVSLPVEEKTVGVACDASVSFPADAVSDTRTTYDGGSLGQTASKGDATKVETVTSFNGSSPVWTTKSTSKFDALGRATSVTDAMNRTTSTAYTPASGGPVTAKKVTNPLGWSATTVIDPARGSETSMTDVDGGVTSATYDPLGRRLQVWLPSHPKSANATSPSYAYAYTQTQTGPLAVATTKLNPTGTTRSTVLYDGLGREVQTQDPSAAGGSVMVDTAYDAQGRVVGKNNGYWASGATPSTSLFVPVSAQQLQSSTQTVYDAVGRQTALITSSYGVDKYRTTSAYIGADRLDTLPPPGGTPTSAFTDSQDHKTLLRQYLGTGIGSSTPSQDTHYAYNARGDMTSMTDPAGNTWRWTFDAVGNKTSTNDPDQGTTSYTYDLAGNQTSSTDARGVKQTTTYDALNRKLGKFAGGPDGAALAAWSYDTVKKGQLTSATSYVGSTPNSVGVAYSSTVTGYSAGNQPTGQTISIGAGAPAFAGTSYTRSQTYFDDGSVATSTAPALGGLAAERVSYTYNALGFASSLSGTKSYGALVYDALNRIAQVNRDGTVVNTSAYTRDAITGEIIGIQDQTGSGSATVVQAKRAYTRNAVGTVTSAVTSGAAGAETQCYQYDAIQELTAAWTPASTSCSSAPSSDQLGGPAPYWHSYTYDTATGNRTSATIHAMGQAADEVSAYSYASAGSTQPHAVQSINRTQGATASEQQYRYDASGNTTSLAETTLQYDETGKAVSVTKDGKTQSNVYDSDGNLLLQRDPDASATLFLGDTELRSSSVGSLTATKTYSIADTTLAERTSKSGTSLVYALDTDINGNADIETDVLTGAVTRRWFTPFGEDRTQHSVDWSSDHGFLNESTSPFSSLSQLGARMYDAEIGRFLSVDPVLAPDNPVQNNGYAYSGNDPVTFSDPSGECYMANDRPGGYCVIGRLVPASNPYYKAPKPQPRAAPAPGLGSHAAPNPVKRTGATFGYGGRHGSQQVYGSQKGAGDCAKTARGCRQNAPTLSPEQVKRNWALSGSIAGKISAGLGVASAALLMSGVGAPVAGVLGIASLAFGAFSTGVTCVQGGWSGDCWVSAGTTAFGAVFFPMKGAGAIGGSVFGGLTGLTEFLPRKEKK
ncbi:RHS repeat-associated core domain-containing protein [Curtobacterium flaccumfaciens]|uniref:RHS repeat-associated core domain-containing protein n=1 Tax=Curtobacterium flaccumfaciens TaxID=2035 RepID=UPI003B00B80B